MMWFFGKPTWKTRQVREVCLEEGQQANSRPVSAMAVALQASADFQHSEGTHLVADVIHKEHLNEDAFE